LNARTSENVLPQEQVWLNAESRSIGLCYGLTILLVKYWCVRKDPSIGRSLTQRMITCARNPLVEYAGSGSDSSHEETFNLNCSTEFQCGSNIRIVKYDKVIISET
jgi:hypothetical protein